MHVDPLYFDYAAATPVDTRVLAAMEPYFQEEFYNPSATYLAGQRTKQALDGARARVAAAIGARPTEVIFTAGGTESTNLAIHGVMQSYPDGELLVSAVEHEAVLAPARHYDARHIPVDSHGTVILAELERMVTDKTVLISVMYANNEVGTIQPIRKVTEIVQRIRADRRIRGVTQPLLVHTDACQAPLYLDVHVARLGADLMTLNGGKLYGPKQSGILYAASHVQLTPQIVGGRQERGMRSGTENVAFAVGFAQALELAQQSRHERIHAMSVLQKYAYEKLQQKIPTITSNGSQKNRLPNNIHITIPGVDNERVLFGLDERGVMAAAGSACSASNEEPSHVLRAMGITDADAQSSIRLTMGAGTTEQSIATMVEALIQAIKY